MRGFPLAFALAALLAACLGLAAQGGGFTSVQRSLIDSDPRRTELGRAEVLGILELTAPERWFGGWSGMAIDGDRVTLVNDSGHWGSFRLLTDAAGRPLGAEDLRVQPLGGLDGSKEDGDAEEIVASPKGWVVSFERRHRLLRYPHGLSGKPVRMAAPAGIASLPDNAGIEALAQLPDGRLLAIAEEGGDEGASPAWIGGQGGWKALSYARQGIFRPTAAAALPDGAVLVVERSFSWLGGVAIRLVRLEAADLRPGVVLSGRELFRLAPPLLVDNYEALAVRRRADGRLVAYLASDDNFNSLQETLLMAVLLPGDAP